MTTPVSAYLGAVDVELYSDGHEAFVYLSPLDTVTDCPHFGAQATLDGREMKQFQFGGEVEGGSLGGPSFTYCDFGSYRLPAARGVDHTTSRIRIADDSGEITVSAADVLSEPTLVWQGSSELRPGELAELAVTPDSLTFEDHQYVTIVGLDAERDFGASAYVNGSTLSFTVPADAPPGNGEVALRYEWQPQLSATVLECAGAASCTATLRFSDGAGAALSVISP